MSQESQRLEQEQVVEKKDGVGEEDVAGVHHLRCQLDIVLGLCDDEDGGDGQHEDVLDPVHLQLQGQGVGVQHGEQYGKESTIEQTQVEPDKEWILISTL